jgi:hypothetical protein
MTGDVFEYYNTTCQHCLLWCSNNKLLNFTVESSFELSCPLNWERFSIWRSSFLPECLAMRYFLFASIALLFKCSSRSINKESSLNLVSLDAIHFNVFSRLNHFGGVTETLWRAYSLAYSALVWRVHMLWSIFHIGAWFLLQEISTAGTWHVTSR